MLKINQPKQAGKTGKLSSLNENTKDPDCADFAALHYENCAFSVPI